MSFRGLMEAPPAGRETFTYEQDLLHGHAYTPQTPDVHFARGMACIDCHTEREVHGDGQIYAKRHYEVELRCETCHGTPDRLATGITAQGRKLRNLFLPSGANPAGLVTLVSKMTGTLHVVPQLAALARQPAGHEPTHLAKTECFTCHTAWAPTCYGCHIFGGLGLVIPSLTSPFSVEGQLTTTSTLIGIGQQGLVGPSQ